MPIMFASLALALDHLDKQQASSFIKAKKLKRTYTEKEWERKINEVKEDKLEWTYEDTGL